MKYKTWRKVEIGCVIAELFLGFLFWIGFAWAGLLLLVSIPVLIILSFLFNRCPHCRRFLGRSGGPHCRYCGKDMEEEPQHHPR